MWHSHSVLSACREFKVDRVFDERVHTYLSVMNTQPTTLHEELRLERYGKILILGKNFHLH